MWGTTLIAHQCVPIVPQIMQMDRAGQCALVHAALRGHHEMVKVLVEAERMSSKLTQDGQVLQQVLTAASSNGHCEVCAKAVVIHCCRHFHEIISIREFE